MARTLADAAAKTFVKQAPESTRVLLAALQAQESALLTWLSNEDDNLCSEWATKYDMWQGTRKLIATFGNEGK